MDESTGTGTDMCLISLETSDFNEDLARFLDETKPDPQIKRQFESWSMEWKNGKLPGNKNLDFTPTHAVSGTLQIQGHYTFLSLTLQSACWWKEEEDKSKGRMVFECKSFIEVFEVDSEDKKEAKMQKKLRERLLADDYIQKLITQPEHSPVCCVARIYQATPSELEERVDCHEEIGEGIRRAILSSADSALDIFEVLVNLPCLPTKQHALARRAKLRLLEDAMCNACEQHGEDELVSDLDLEGEGGRSDERERSKRTRT